MNKTEVEELSKQQLLDLESQLQSESDLLIKNLGILETLSKYGQPEIVGSKKMGLMIKKDVDIACPVDDFGVETWVKVCADLLRTQQIRRITPINYVDYDKNGFYSPGNPDAFSYYISFNKLSLPFIENSQEWEVQIHLLKKPGLDALQKAEEIIKQLDDETKESILRIKLFVKEVLVRSSGPERIDSPTIYKAVLEESVRTTEDFLKYIKK